VGLLWGCFLSFFRSASHNSTADGLVTDASTPISTIVPFTPHRAEENLRKRFSFDATDRSLLLLLFSFAYGSTQTMRSHFSHSYRHRTHSHGTIKRSRAARAAFVREHPCPSTGKTRGRCPGYIVDTFMLWSAGEQTVQPACIGKLCLTPRRKTGLSGFEGDSEVRGSFDNLVTTQLHPE
jgi:hypothetical protein